MPSLAVSVDFREMVVNVFEAEADIVPLLTPVTNEVEQLNVLVPSVLCVTLTVFVITTSEPLVVFPVLNFIPENECFVPSIVIEPVHSPVALYEPPVQLTVAFTVTFEVLFATL